MPLELVIQCPGQQVRNMPLTGARLSVGRSSAADLCFPEDSGLSRLHFAFEPEGDGWTVQDLGSKNGTYVNEIALKGRLILKPGDRITAGHLAIDYSPEAGGDSSVRVVVFEGDQSSSASTSTVVTTLTASSQAIGHSAVLNRAGEKNSAMQALIQAGRVLLENRPLGDLFPLRSEEH